MQGMDLISIGNRRNVGGAYRSVHGSTCGCRRAKRDRSGHVAVDGSVSAGVHNMTVEGDDGMEKCGIGFGVTFEVFHVGEKAA